MTFIRVASLTGGAGSLVSALANLGCCGLGILGPAGALAPIAGALTPLATS